MPPSGPRRSFFSALRSPHPLVLTAVVAVLLTLFWWLAVSASREKSHTTDELPHIGAGFAYDRFGDFRFQPENGNLPQRLFGLPGLAADAKFPVDAHRWSQSEFWQLSWDYFYALDNPVDQIIQQARSLNALLGAALGLLIFLLARDRFGSGGGLLALSFYIFAPQFLAHSALATSDLCATFFLTLAPWLFWRHLEKRDLTSGALAALVSGLALVSKFNGLLIAPIYALLIAADLWLRSEKSVAALRRRFFADVALVTLQAAAGIFLIWAFYNFRFSVRGPTAPEFVSFHYAWEKIFPFIGLKAPLIQFALRWHLMPEAWLFGLGFVLSAETARPAFFAGEYSQWGWWQFFPALFLTKTTLPMLCALVLSFGVGLVTWLKTTASVRHTWLITTCPLVLTAAVVGFTALRSNLNIGDRHILAVFPVLFIALGLLVRTRAILAAAIVLLAGHVFASFAIRPHYLASFNSIAGGSDNAHRLFVDSSLDWGQDLPTLRTWLAAHRRPDEKLFLGYFGSAWPPHYGVRPDHFLPSASYIVRPPHLPYELEPGLYCISATTLAEVYSSYRGQWTPEFERQWQAFRTMPPTAQNFREFDEIRFARLCKFLQLRTPDANLGYTILVFRLTSADLRTALEAPATGAYHMRPIR